MNQSCEQEDKSKFFQKFLDLLKIEERVAHINNGQSNGRLNFEVKREEKYFTLEVQQRQRYIYVNPQENLNMTELDLPNSNIISDDLKYSIVTLLHYYQDIKSQDQKASTVCNSRKTFLNLANQFMKVLGSKRQYTDVNQVKWSTWATYWSKPNRSSSCYSNCSGACTQSCQGAQCLYFFPLSEQSNPNLPNSEKVDPFNVFSDQLYWLASLYSDFIVEELKKYENFFFFPGQNNQKGIKVELLNGEVVSLESFEQLYNDVQKDQIKSICILTLEQRYIPQGEQQREELYNYILSLNQLTSLQVQLEHAIYHTSEEIDLELSDFKFSIAVSENVVINFATFLLKLKVSSLSLLLDEVCYPITINLNNIFVILPKLNPSIHNFHLSINYRRMDTAQHILDQLSQMKYLQNLYLHIKDQWNFNHCTIGQIEDDFDQWIQIIKKQCPSIQKIIIN